MSVPFSSLPATGLPVVSQARAPQWVRDGSAATKQAYATAQGFEEMLVNELSQSLAQSSGLEGEGGEGASSETGQERTSDAGAGVLNAMLPQALGEGVMREGGLGLAAELTPALERSAGALTTRASQSASASAQGSGGATVTGSGGTRA